LATDWYRSIAEVDIHQDEVDRPGGGDFSGRLSGGGDGDVVPGALQHLLFRHRDERFVFNEENMNSRAIVCHVPVCLSAATVPQV
jgi:hypothetical protein